MSNKDEFSVNELEPIRNTDTTNNIEVEQIAQVAESEVVSEPVVETPKETIVSASVDSDYEGPTAKEIIVNSVKMEKTKTRNIVGAIVIVIAALLVGGIFLVDYLSKDEDVKPEVELDPLPEWVVKYDTYIKENYKNMGTFSVTFLDIDFNNDEELLISYKKDGKDLFDVIDINNVVTKSYNRIAGNKVLMIYSFNTKNVVWYIDASLNENDLLLYDLNKKINNEIDYETHLVNSDVNLFKSDHFNISYDLVYTKFNMDTYDIDIRSAVKKYEEEKENVLKIKNSIIDKYKDFS